MFNKKLSNILKYKNGYKMNLFASFLFPAFFISHNKIMHIQDIEFLSTRKYINMRRTTHCVLLSHHLSLAHCHSNVCVSSTSNNTLSMQHINTQLYQIHILLEWTIIDTFLIVTAMIVQK